LAAGRALGQRQSRGREATDFVSLHAALVEQARARAAARVVRAYGSSVVAAERLSVLSELLASARAEADMIAERVKNGRRDRARRFDGGSPKLRGTK